MKYVNAKTLLPDLLIKELQGYLQGGYIYIPVCEEKRLRWGALSGYKRELQRRNSEIVKAYRNGMPMEGLAEEYSLSVSAIRKIIYQN